MWPVGRDHADHDERRSYLGFAIWQEVGAHAHVADSTLTLRLAGGSVTAPSASPFCADPRKLFEGAHGSEMRHQRKPASLGSSRGWGVVFEFFECPWSRQATPSAASQSS